MTFFYIEALLNRLNPHTPLALLKGQFITGRRGRFMCCHDSRWQSGSYVECQMNVRPCSNNKVVQEDGKLLTIHWRSAFHLCNWFKRAVGPPAECVTHGFLLNVNGAHCHSHCCMRDHTPRYHTCTHQVQCTTQKNPTP